MFNHNAPDRIKVCDIQKDDIRTLCSANVGKDIIVLGFLGDNSHFIAQLSVCSRYQNVHVLGLNIQL